MKNGKPDPNRSFGLAFAYVVRNKDDPVAWDGKQFSRLAKPVLYTTGLTAVREYLDRLRVPMSEHPRSAQQIAEMLMTGRAEVAVLRESDAIAVTRNEKYRDRLEMLSPPFLRINIYFPVNRDFQARDPEYVEAIWKEIGRLRTTSQWKKLAPQLAK